MIEPRSQPQAINAFIARKAKIDAMLKRIADTAFREGEHAD